MCKYSPSREFVYANAFSKVDMEKLADGLQKLNEDDLLHVVTLIHDNKSNETYTKNDVESKF